MNRIQQLMGQMQSNSITQINANNCHQSSDKYRYTLDEFANKVFTKQQRDFYEENGYIVIKNLLPQQDVDICNKRFDDLVSNPKLRLNEMVLMRDIALMNKKNKLSTNRTSQAEVTKLQMFAYDPVFIKHYSAHPKILPYLKAFVGADLRSWHHMYINKPTDPGTLSSRHPLHQDLWYFPLTNNDRVVTCWTALQPVNRNNGGLCIIPGSHKASDTGKILIHDYPKWSGPTNHLYVAIPNDIYMKVRRKRIHLDMQPGDCVFFHSLTIHGSSANLSDRYRRSLCCHFLNSKQCSFLPFIRYDRVKYGKLLTGTLRPKRALSKTQFTYKTWFKFKSRQIMGDAGDWELNDKEFEKGEKEFYKRKLNRKDFQRNPTLNQHLM